MLLRHDYSKLEPSVVEIAGPLIEALVPRLHECDVHVYMSLYGRLSAPAEVDASGAASESC